MTGASTPICQAKVVIVGGGFAGLACAARLASSGAEITLVDRQNHHCFQPLLYQVATAALAPNDVAWPIRSILKSKRNVRTVLDEVTGVDTKRRLVMCSERELPYDYLVLATGATHSYFGHDGWAGSAPGLKRIEDAVEIRRRVLTAFEAAERAEEEHDRRRNMTFVIVGGGPTGVELAGAIAELAHSGLSGEFREIEPASARIVLVEAGPRILSAFPPELSSYAERALCSRHVEVKTGVAVTFAGHQGVETAQGHIPAAVIVWAAGVAASAAGHWLDAPQDRAGRVVVQADLSVPGHSNIFVVGDTAAAMDRSGKQVPGIAPAAKQMGKYAAKVIRARLAGEGDSAPFRYRHQGDLATIGRNAAVVRMGKLTLTGFPGWLVWSVAHVYFLIGARNRIAVAFNWVWDYVTGGRSVRLIASAPGAPADSHLAPTTEQKSSPGLP